MNNYVTSDMAARQRGLTIQGLLVGLAIMGFFIFIGLRLFPLYNEKFQVDSILEALVTVEGIEKMNSVKIGRLFIRSANVNDLSRFSDSNIKDYLVLNKPRRKKDPKTITMKFEARGPIIENLDVVLIYERTMVLGAEE